MRPFWLTMNNWEKLWFEDHIIHAEMWLEYAPHRMIYRNHPCGGAGIAPCFMEL